MKKIVKKIGNSLGVIINSEEVKIYDLKEGDVVDIELFKTSKKVDGTKKR